MYRKNNILPSLAGTWAVFIFLSLQCALFLPAVQADSTDFEGFLEPNQVVDISSPFRDRIEALHVHDGDTVSRGQLLAELDSRVLKADLTAAGEATKFHGAVDAARALVTMRRNRLTMLRELEKSGNARPQEMLSARTDLAMARAQLQSALEKQRLKKLDLQVIEAKIEEKKLRSPLDGVVKKVYKQQFELVGGGDREPLLTLVQLDPLLGRFHLPPDAAQRLHHGQSVQITTRGSSVAGEVEFISPVIDPQSGTMAVRIRIPNKKHTLTSGSRCYLTLTPLAGDKYNDERTEQTTTDQSPLQ